MMRRHSRMTTTIKKRYTLGREIGRGATATVYLSRDERLGRDVAVKLLRSDRHPDDEAQARFRREAWTVAQLHSPHVVQVFDYGLHETQPFIVMELLEGETLEERLARHGRLPLSVVTKILVDVARGLTRVHQAGVVHRDIKPANIFLAREHGREVAKLLDFGIAILAGAAPGLHAIEGTPLYMSPEHRRGVDGGGADDCWSLAVVAYQMLTGICPFDRELSSERTMDLGAGSFVPPSDLVAELPPAIDAWFARALAASAADRMNAVAELAASFVALAELEPQAPIGLLFIDDEPDMRMLIELKLRAQVSSGRYVLHFAFDGIAGLELLQEHPEIMVVLTDLNMPRMDGLTLLARVPKVNPLIRVVVVTAYGDMANIRAAMNQGAFDFLEKPIDFPDLERTVEKCCEHVSELRYAVRSREENEVLRALVGHGVVDRFIASLRAVDSLGCRSFDATVAYIDVAKFSRVLATEAPIRSLGHLNAYFELIAAELDARGGIISRFVGDAVLAIFEGSDHLVRAIEACLAVASRARTVSVPEQRATIQDFGVTVGIDSGALIAGGTGSSGIGRIEPTVLGAAVSTAARLQSVAEPHEILVTASVRERLADAYVFKAAGERILAASEPPAAVFRVIGAAHPHYSDPLDSTRAADQQTLVFSGE